MDEEQYAAARARIAAARGRLRGWRPLPLGEVAVVAADVLGMAAGQPDTVGLRVMVAARDAAAVPAHGREAVERALRKRGILEEGDRCEVVNEGEIVYPASAIEPDDMLSWPFASFVVHVPVSRLPAIAGLTTDAVRG